MTEVRVGRPVRWVDRAGLALAILLAALLWLVIGLRVQAEFRGAAEEAFRTTATLARTTESQVAGRLRSLDAILRYGAAFYADDPNGFSVNRWIGIVAGPC
jgi:hypothetical protein